MQELAYDLARSSIYREEKRYKLEEFDVVNTGKTKMIRNCVCQKFEINTTIHHVLNVVDLSKEVENKVNKQIKKTKSQSAIFWTDFDK